MYAQFAFARVTDMTLIRKDIVPCKSLVRNIEIDFDLDLPKLAED